MKQTILFAEGNAKYLQAVSNVSVVSASIVKERFFTTLSMKY